MGDIPSLRRRAPSGIRWPTSGGQGDGSAGDGFCPHDRNLGPSRIILVLDCLLSP